MVSIEHLCVVNCPLYRVDCYYWHTIWDKIMKTKTEILTHAVGKVSQVF